MALESIALIPSGYKATKVYSQLPVSGNGDFTFDRGTSTNQTRINKNGLIESVAQDVPRLDYLDGGCPSLLLEPSSTNLIPYSEELDNVYYTQSNITITANNALSPDGSVNAELFTENVMASSQSRIFRSSIVVSSGVSYTLSAFVKFTATSRQFYMGCSVGSGSSNAGRIYVNSDGSFSLDGSADGGKVIDYGNGWYRVEVNATSATTSGTIFVGFADGETAGSETYTSDGSATMYVFGVQLEQQSYATSYMPSLSGVSGVRNSETCNGAGTTAEINSQEGVLFAEIRALAETGVNRYISLNSGLSSERLVIRFDNSDRVSCYAENNPYTTGIALVDAIDITKYHKVALYWSGTTLRFYVNGLFVGEDTSWVAFSSGELDALEMSSSGGSFPFHGRVKKLSVYDQALSTTELESLTGFSSFSEMKSYLSYS